MSEPNLTLSGGSATDKLRCDASRVGSDKNTTKKAETGKPTEPEDTLGESHQPVSSCTEDVLIDTGNDETRVSYAEVEALSAQEHQDLLGEARSHQKAKRGVSAGETNRHNQSERIGQLENALEQSLTSLSELRQELRDQHLLEDQLAATEGIANLQQQAITELKKQLAQRQAQLRTAEKSTIIAVLKQNLVKSQVKIEDLAIQLAQQHLLQAQLQHSCLEIKRERDHILVRLTQMEQQTAALQEQIIQQSQQASEYEVTVQYWKDKYLESLKLAHELKAVLERLLPDRVAEFSDLLIEFQPLAAFEPTKLPSPPLKHQPLRVDLPAFLTRQRHSRC